MYDYRRMTPAQRREAVEYRRLRMRPWHSPPHWEFQGLFQFMISSACYEHKHLIGVTPERMTECESEILAVCGRLTTNIYAWCVLPNHYHLLIQTDRLKELRAEFGRFHGRTSFRWNSEDNRRGRKAGTIPWTVPLPHMVTFGQSVNYIHHNPVHHGYAEKWQDWPWSSAAAFVERVGRETVSKIWRQFPVLDYGKTWDVD